MDESRLIVGICPRGRGEALATAANAAGAGGGTLVFAEGTAPNALLQFLGIGGTSRELLMSVVAAEKAPAVKAAIRATAASAKRFGVLFETTARALLRFGTPAAQTASAPAADASVSGTYEDKSMNEKNELVCFIVNKGYADDVMAAARKAGAGGGTVVPARGTAKPGDETFLGVPLVPEKEMLLAIVPAADAVAVCDAVRALPCLSEAGSGIAFRVPVTDFSPLGGS